MPRGVLPEHHDDAWAYLKKCTYEELRNLLDQACRRRIQLQISRRGNTGVAKALEEDADLIRKAQIMGQYKRFKNVDTPIEFTWTTYEGAREKWMIFENIKIYRTRDHKYTVSYGKSQEVEHHPVSVYCKTFKNIKEAFEESFKLGKQLAPHHIQKKIKAVCKSHNIKI